jgi:hypothetical protein
MSVLVEAISVVVPIPVLEAAYPGGLAQYERDCPNGTFCADEQLTRIGFMTPADVGAFVERLESLGIVHQRDGRAADLVVVDQIHGPTSQCDWIEGGRHPDGYSAVWRAGTVPGWFAHPKGWRIGQSSQLIFAPDAEADERFLRLARDKNLETVLDYETGKQLYIGRVRRPADS